MKNNYRKRDLVPEDICRLVHVAEPIGNGRGEWGFCEKIWDPEKHEYRGSCHLTASDGTQSVLQGQNFSAPSITTDGMLVSCICEAEKKSLFIYDLNMKSEVHRIENAPVTEHRWAPDGKRLAYIGYTEKNGPESDVLIICSSGRKTNADRGFIGERSYALSVFDIETGISREIYKETRPLRRPIWLEREDAIIFYSSQDVAYKKVNAASGEVQTLCTGLTLTGKWTSALTALQESVLFVPTARFDNGSGQCDRLTCVRTDGSGIVETVNVGDVPWEFVPLYGDGDMLVNQNEYLAGGGDYIYAIGAQNAESGIYQARLHIDMQRVVLEWKKLKAGGCFTAIATVDEHRLLTVWSNEITPPELYMLDTYTGEMTAVTKANAWIEDYVLADRTTFPVQVGDSAMEGYYVLPQLKDTMPVPAVLTIHGGPACFYSGGFSMERQLLVAAGIAVIYGNPRGSTGYGADYAKSDLAFGRAAEEDAVAFVRAALAAESALASQRIGVMGGSYGGYLTAKLAAGKTPFKAACALRGLFNHYLLLANSESAGSSLPAKEAKHIFKELLTGAALCTADQIAIPTLICHGEKDQCCPVEGALQLYTAIRSNRAKPPVRLRIFEHCGHGIDPDSAENTSDYYQEIIDWLIKYL